MNHLAHTFLSCKDQDLLAGNFMADFLSRAEHKALEPNILLGVALHKKIDKFTDGHPDVRSAVKLLHPTQGKYAPVTIDILFDFFLIKNWDKYSTENIQIFTTQIYEMLESTKDDFPPKLREKLPLMISDDFLMSCKDEERLKKTFERIGKRAKFSNNFHTAHNDLNTHFEILDTHFNSFFPELLSHIHDFCDCN